MEIINISDSGQLIITETIDGMQKGPLKKESEKVKKQLEDMYYLGVVTMASVLGYIDSLPLEMEIKAAILNRTNNFIDKHVAANLGVTDIINKVSCK